MYRLCLNIKILKKLFLNGALMITGYSTGPQGMKKKTKGTTKYVTTTKTAGKLYPTIP